MRPAPRLFTATASITALFGAAVPAAAESRPYIFGCGITWGQWLQLAPQDAREFDRRSMDRILQMGGTNCPANFAWGDIERVRGVCDWSYVDHQVEEALARGLTVFAHSRLRPDWALPQGILDQYGPGIGYRFPPDEPYIPDFENLFRTAPGVPQPDPACREADLDRDHDVDAADFGILQRCLTGPGMPGSPDC